MKAMRHTFNQISLNLHTQKDLLKVSGEKSYVAQIAVAGLFAKEKIISIVVIILIRL